MGDVLDIKLNSNHSLFLVQEESIIKYMEYVEKYKLIDQIYISPIKMFSEKNALVALMNLWIFISHNPKTLSIDPYKIMAYPAENILIQSLQKINIYNEFQKKASSEEQIYLANYLFLQIDKWLTKSTNPLIHEIISQHKKEDYFLIWENPAWEQDLFFLKKQKELVYAITSNTSYNRAYQLMIKKAILQTQRTLKRVDSLKK